MARTVIINLVLATASILLVSAASEIAYRSYLTAELHASSNRGKIPAELSYTIYDQVWSTFDREFGYTPKPGGRFLKVKVRKGLVTSCTPFRTNQIGNFQRSEGGYRGADLKILVFGDSFTANIHHDGKTWPDLLQNILDERSGRKVQVVNFGRPGYGVIQIFDLAAEKIRQYQPDLMILAFITNDLARARFWRAQQIIEGRARYFTTTEPRKTLDSGSSVEVALIHSGVSREWCKEMLTSRKRDDPILLQLNKMFEERLSDINEAVDMRSLSRFFLLNRIVHGDPFYGGKRTKGNPKLTLNDFRSDPRMLENVDKLNRSRTPYILLHLPTFPEVEAGRYKLDIQEKALLKSLEAATGKKVLSLLDEASASRANAARFFLLPEDPHPSVLGMRYFAEATSEMLISGGWLE